MGYLDDMRKSDVTWVTFGMPIAFWTIIGAVGAGAVVAVIVPSALDEAGILLGFSLVGGTIGLAVGLFAALGQSVLAKILAIPSLILFGWFA